MAFVLENLAPVGNTSRPYSAIGSPGAPRFWSYASNDTQAVINTAGYFNDAANLLSVYDTIRGICDIDGTPLMFDFIVLSNAAGVVDVSDGHAIALTDTD